MHVLIMITITILFCVSTYTAYRCIWLSKFCIYDSTFCNVNDVLMIYSMYACRYGYVCTHASYTQFMQ